MNPRKMKEGRKEQQRAKDILRLKVTTTKTFNNNQTNGTDDQIFYCLESNIQVHRL
jgi:hypothetical protein